MAFRGEQSSGGEDGLEDLTKAIIEDVLRMPGNEVCCDCGASGVYRCSLCVRRGHTHTHTSSSCWCSVDPHLSSAFLRPLMSLCADVLFQATHRSGFLCNVTAALNSLSFGSMVTEQATNPPAAFNKCVCVCALLAFRTQPDPDPPPHWEARTQHSGVA